MTQDQFQILNDRLDGLMRGDAELRNGLSEIGKDVRRLGALVEALPTAKDLNRVSLGLLALTAFTWLGVIGLNLAH